MILKYLIPLVFLFSIINVPAQDSLNQNILQEYTIHFQINKDGSLDDTGNSFFSKETKENQYLIFGEYHNSQAISQLTEVVIPIFSKNGGKFMALEIGPVSQEILEELNKKGEGLKKALYDFNTRYSYTKNSGNYTAIPFFSNVSDAQFLSAAFENNLRIIGLDQEFLYGSIPLVSKAYEDLPEEQRNIYKEDFLKVTDTLKHYYTLEIEDSYLENNNGVYFVELFHDSEFVNSFLDKISVNKENKEIVEALKTSMEIYWLRSRKQGDYWKSNSLRTDNFIRNLSKGLKEKNFDHSKDKMLIKIGGLHSAKGQNNYSMYDIGNTISELARFHGNSSLNSVFLSRYYRENDSIVDVLDSDNWQSQNFKAFLQMGKKDEWTIIDLRPMRNLFYYKRKYLVNDLVKQYFDRYDLIIITPLEEPPTPNYEN